MSTPPLGILLDVDGPVSSPVTRTVPPAPLLDDVRALLAAGVPVVLNTGRSTAFVDDQVFGPLAAAGLPERARLHAICEKGGSWMLAHGDGIGEVHTDPALCVPDVARDLVQRLVDDGYGDAMFVDATKQVMATVEARTDVPNDVYLERQRGFDAELLAGLTAAGLGVRLRDERHPDVDRRTPWRIDPSVIATDVESDHLGQGPRRLDARSPSWPRTASSHHRLAHRGRLAVGLRHGRPPARPRLRGHPTSTSARSRH